MYIKTVIFCFLLVITPLAIAGESLAYLKYVNNYWQVFLFDLSTQKEQQLTHGQFDKAKLSLFDKQKKLLATGIQGELVYIDIDKKQASPVQQLNALTNDVVVSEDGRYLLYSAISKKSDLNKLFIKDNQTDKAHQVFHMEGVQFDPAWSADNKSFYFVKGDKYSPYAVWKSSIDGLKQQPVIRHVHHVLDIAVSKDGALVYSTNQAGNYDIWLSEDNKSVQLTRYKGYDGKPVITQDAKKVYYESIQNGVSNIWMVKVAAPFVVKQITFSKQGIRHPIVVTGVVN